MKKVFTLLFATLCSISSFAQILSLIYDGKVIENGSSVTIEGRYDDIIDQLHAEVYLKNNSDVVKQVAAKFTAIKGDIDVCWPNSCKTIKEGNNLSITPSASTIIRPGQEKDLRIECFTGNTGIATRTIEILVWCEDEDENIEEQITATVTFTSDPIVLGVSTPATEVPQVTIKDNQLQYNFSNAVNRYIQIYDIAGKQQRSISLNNATTGSVSLEGMTKGLYLYRIVESDTNKHSGKFLIK